MIDVKKYRDDNPYLYGDSSLKEVAADLFKYDTDLQSAYANVDDWAEKEGLKASWDDDEAATMAKRRHREIALQRQQNVNDMNFFTRSIARGYNQTQAMLGGAIGLSGDLVGSESLKQWGLDSYKKNSEEASLYPGTDIKDITDAPLLMKPFKAGQWALEKLGENIPNIALTMATAGTAGVAAGTSRVVGGKIVQKALGGMLAKSVRNQIAGKGILKKLVTRQGITAADRAILQAADRAVVQNIAAKAGIVASTGALEAGGMYTEGADEGFHNPVSALGLGILSGFTEIVGGVPTRQIERIFGKKVSRSFFGALKRVQDADAKPGDVGFVARVFKGAMESMTEEAAQEGVQEAIQLANHIIANNDPGFEVLSMDSLKRVAESMAAGGAVGALMGGASGIIPTRTDINTPESNRALIDSKRAKGAIAKIVGGELAKEQPTKENIPVAEKVIEKLKSGDKITQEEAKILKEAISKAEEKAPEKVLSDEISTAEDISIESLSKNKKVKDAIEAISEGKTLKSEAKQTENITKKEKEAKLEEKVPAVGKVQKEKPVIGSESPEAKKTEKGSATTEKAPEVTGRHPASAVDETQAQAPEPVAPKVEANRESAQVPANMGENEKLGWGAVKEVHKDGTTKGQPWEKSDLSIKPNIPDSYVKAEKKSNGKYRLNYVGTRNEVFQGEEFNNPSEAMKFFRAQKAKAQEAAATKEHATRPEAEKAREEAQVDQTMKDLAALKAAMGGEKSQAVGKGKPVLFADAKPGDRLVSPNEEYLVEKGIKLKRDAEKLAKEVGGKVFIDRNKWDVVSNKKPQTTPAVSTRGAGGSETARPASEKKQPSGDKERRNPNLAEKDTSTLNETDAGAPSLVSAGEEYTSQSGRKLSPVPNKIDLSTPIKSKNSVKRINAWLKDEAIKEAIARDDNFNKRGFEAINLKNISRADQDSMNLYLFGNHDGPNDSATGPKKRGYKELASVGKPGDKAKLRGISSQFIESFTEEGVSTELWRGEEGSGFVRRVDGDSGKSIDIVQHTDFNHMKNRYEKEKEAFLKRSAVNKPQNKKLPDLSGYDLGAIKIKIKERIAETPDKTFERTVSADEAIKEIDTRVESCYELAGCLGIKL